MAFIIPILDVLKRCTSFSDPELILIRLLSTRFNVIWFPLVTAIWHMYHTLVASSVDGRVILEIRGVREEMA